MTSAIGPTTHQRHSPTRWVLAGDLDGTTLAQTPQGSQQIFSRLAQQSNWLSFGFITGRPIDSAMMLNLPSQADFLMTDNGGEMYHRQRPGQHPFFDATTSPSHIEDMAWQNLNAQSRFDKAGVLEAAQRLGKQYDLLVTNFDDWVTEAAGDNKITLVIQTANIQPGVIPQFTEALNTVLLEKLPDMQFAIGEPYLDETPQGIPAIFVDVATPIANKGMAFGYEQNRHGWDPNHTIVAINGGNDLPLLNNDGRYAIIIGNNRHVQIEALRRMSRDKLYFSPTPGFGVLQGINAIRARHDAQYPPKTLAWA